MAFSEDFGRDPLVDSYRLARLRELIDSYKTETVIKFIRQNPDTTVDKVAKHLQQEKICSRLTTLAVVKDLLDIGLIIDDRKGKYFHSLSYNENFNYREIARRLLKTDVKKDFRFFDKFVFGDYPTEEQVKELGEYIDMAINEHYGRLSYHESDELHRFPPTSTKKKGKKGK